MATKLDTLLGVLQDVKKNVNIRIDTVYKTVQKPHLFNGFYKAYRPLDEEHGEKFPDEEQLVQHGVYGLLTDLVPDWARMIDLQTTVDSANQNAVGTIVLRGPGRDEQIEIEDVPVSTLLWLHKELLELRKIIEKAPVLDPAKTWTLDEQTGQFVTASRETAKTRKVTRPLVLYPATDKHPAQVQPEVVDERIGTWVTTDRSGAMAPADKLTLLARIDAAVEAVRRAKSQANSVEVTDVRIGETLLRHLLRPGA